MENTQAPFSDRIDFQRNFKVEGGPLRRTKTMEPFYGRSLSKEIIANA